MFWKNQDDYKKEGQFVVWSTAIAGLLLILVGFGMMVWSISKRADTDVADRSLKEQSTASPPRSVPVVPETLPEASVKSPRSE